MQLDTVVKKRKRKIIKKKKKSQENCFLFLISYISDFNNLDFLNLKDSHFSEHKKVTLNIILQAIIKYLCHTIW